MKQKGLTPIVILIIIASLAIISIAVVRFQKPNNTSVTEIAQSPKPLSSPDISPSVQATSKPKTVLTPKPSAIPSSTPTPTPTPSPTASSISITPSCEISVKNSSTGWAPLWVQFSAKDNSPTGTPDSQKWDFDGDGKWDIESSLDDTNVSNVYQNTGTYNVKLQMHSSIGESTCSTTVTVKPASVECMINASPTSGSAPLQVNLTYGASFHGVIGDDYVTNVQWDYTGDGNWDTPLDYSSQRTSYTYSQPGNYTVKMQLESKAGLKSEVCTKTITVN